MKIIAADDETIALEVLVDSIKEAEPNAEVISFKTGKEVLEYLSSTIRRLISSLLPVIQSIHRMLSKYVPQVTF